MEKLLKNRKQVPEMGMTARQLVLEKYSMPVATEGLKAALKSICNEFDI